MWLLSELNPHAPPDGDTRIQFRGAMLETMFIDLHAASALALVHTTVGILRSECLPTLADRVKDSVTPALALHWAIGSSTHPRDTTLSWLATHRALSARTPARQRDHQPTPAAPGVPGSHAWPAGRWGRRPPPSTTTNLAGSS